LSQSDHCVIVEVSRASDHSFEWVFIVYPDVGHFGDLRDLGEFGDLRDQLDCRDASMHLSWHEDNGKSD